MVIMAAALCVLLALPASAFGSDLVWTFGGVLKFSHSGAVPTSWELFSSETTHNIHVYDASWASVSVNPYQEGVTWEYGMTSPQYMLVWGNSDYTLNRFAVINRAASVWGGGSATETRTIDVTHTINVTETVVVTETVPLYSYAGPLPVSNSEVELSLPETLTVTPDGSTSDMLAAGVFGLGALVFCGAIGVAFRVGGRS